MPPKCYPLTEVNFSSFHQSNSMHVSGLRFPFCFFSFLRFPPFFCAIGVFDWMLKGLFSLDFFSIQCWFWGLILMLVRVACVQKVVLLMLVIGQCFTDFTVPLLSFMFLVFKKLKTSNWYYFLVVLFLNIKIQIRGVFQLLITSK